MVHKDHVKNTTPHFSGSSILYTKEFSVSNELLRSSCEQLYDCCNVRKFGIIHNSVVVGSYLLILGFHSLNNK